MIPPGLDEIAVQLTGDADSCAASLDLLIGDYALHIDSNSPELVAQLADYLGHVPQEPVSGADRMVIIERSAPDIDLPFADWPREAGKKGRKDAWCDVPGGRLVRKVRTGMLFMQSRTLRVAAGPCLENPNQVINFINAQYMNHLQQQGWLLCHAAALCGSGGALAIAGLSGGGKSTLMLRLLEDEGLRYLTNDRLLIRRAKDGTVAAEGIPKLPRINPGTLVSIPRLRALVDRAQCEAWDALPRDRLWALEQKHDVPVATVYGPDRIVQRAALREVLVLNWRHDHADPVRVDEVEIASRPDLLGALMKSAGPFGQFADGGFLAPGTEPDAGAYLECLSGVQVCEVTGLVDFGTLVSMLEERVRESIA